MQKPGLDAYKRTIDNTSSGRALEASVLTRAAHMLKDCQDNWEKEGHFARLNDALAYNQKLWTFFQTELINAENPLPRNIRQDLIELSIFIDKRIIEIAGSPTREKLTAIININLNIAEGLRSRG